MSRALFPDLIVNGETVPHALVATETQNHEAPRGKPGIAWRKAANAVAIRTLLLQEARRQNVTPEPQEVGPGRRETDEEALIRGLLETALSVEVPSEEAVRAEWERKPTRFRTPPLWEVSHILCACDPGDESSSAKAQARAKRLTEELFSHPAGFGRLAQEQSDCSSKSSGGQLGQISPGDTMPEFEAALRTLQEGEITTAPVLTRYGWHVIRLDAVADTAPLPFDAVRQKISDAIQKVSWARAAQAFVGELIAAADISGAEIGADPVPCKSARQPRVLQ